MKLDAIDRKLLEMLQKDTKKTTKELSDKLNLKSKIISKIIDIRNIF